MALIVAVVNQKGGVLKTTVSANLSAGLALKDYDVLVLDLDSQCNLTQSLIGDIGDQENICEVILSNGKRKIDNIIRDTKIDKLKIVPAGESLVDAELNMTNMVNRESLLEKALNNKILDEFDFLIIDNSPSIGLLTLNSLVASDYALIPVSCEYLPMIGLKYILNKIELVKSDRKLNSRLKILGYILTLYDKRESITMQVEDILRKQFKNLIFNNVIRINTKAKAAPAKQLSIFHYEKLQGRGTSDYRNLTLEFIERIKNNENATA